MTLIDSDTAQRLHINRSLTCFDGDPVGTSVGLEEGDVDGSLLGLFEGDKLGLDVGFVCVS